jgi:hypothetical protein
LQFRNRLAQLYTEVFATEGSSGINDLEQASVSRKWGWFTFIYSLSKGDVLRVEGVTSQRIHTALQWSAYEMDLQEMEKKLTDKIRNKWK